MLYKPIGYISYMIILELTTPIKTNQKKPHYLNSLGKKKSVSSKKKKNPLNKSD